VALIHTEQPTVGDRDAMRVPRKIGEDMLGTGEGLFRVNDPAGSAQWRQSGGEHLRIVEARDSGPREHADRKESRLAGNPALAV